MLQISVKGDHDPIDEEDGVRVWWIWFGHGG